MSKTEKRSIPRHSLEEFIRLDGDDEVWNARTVDVSRNGMKVVVPGSRGLDADTLVSVKLPGTSGEGIPCRIRRSLRGDGHWEVGLEFDGENDARMLLVERWLDSLERRGDLTDSAPTESRQVPRTRCSLTNITCTDDEVDVLSVEDISLDGMLVRIRGTAEKGRQLNLSLKLDSSDRDIPMTTRVAYVSDDGEYLGLSITEMKELYRNRLRQFIVDIASGAAMLEYHRLLEAEDPGEDFRIDDDEAGQLVSSLISERTTVNVLDESGLRIFETYLEEGGAGSFTAQVPGMEAPGPSAFFSFSLEGSSYTFSTLRMESDTPGEARFEYPRVIYRGEKRTGRRHAEENSPNGVLDVDGKSVEVQILDTSRRGILCRAIPEELEGEALPDSGTAAVLKLPGKPPLSCEIRHVVAGEDIRIGLETGIRRRPAEIRKYSDVEWSTGKKGERRALGDSRLVRPRIVEYDDGRGRRIVGLLHLLDENRPCTAVVIPPAFGKKKEVPAPLALTLMTHFAAAGENVAVLRYDGIDRPGESDNSNRHARRGYEMLGYRIDQGYVDLAASLHWVKDNRYFRAEKTVVVSFSMSALDARRLQADPTAPGADYWISVMGVSSSQGALRNILGGLDVIGNHRMGMPIGTMGMLGQLIDMDRMSSDMVRLGYASASDAREAMARISTPVTWIYGAYDKWMIPEEIRDVMSIAAEGCRELVEVPTAHNLRTSDDALFVFRIISASILRRLNGRDVPPVSPDKGELLDLISRERERITENEELDTRRYWTGYLIGESTDDEGYDFYGRLREFREFMELEAELLDPRPGESVADLGCGTGLVSQAILKHLASPGQSLEGTCFTAVDLVAEALGKAREKYDRLAAKHPVLENLETRWIAMDLEPDPLAAIRRNLEKEGPKDPESLRDRVRGLKAETVDRLAALPGTLVDPILSGDVLTPSFLADLESCLSPVDVMACRDLNLGARYLAGRIRETDLKPSRRAGTGPMGADRIRAVRTSDLQLQVLDFGDSGREGRLDFRDGEFDAVCASLFLSYLFTPDEAVREFTRMLRPGGRLLVSTMKPDSDISGIFTSYIAEQAALKARSGEDGERERNLREARNMLNEAAALFSLEEDGWFRFFDTGEIITMMRDAGLSDIRITESLGKPEQAIIITGIKKNV